MKIFVIITTKNRIDLLSKAILSVLNQTRKPDEIILVTDSTDKIRLLEKELINNLNSIYLIDISKDNKEHNIQKRAIRQAIEDYDIDDEDKLLRLLKTKILIEERSTEHLKHIEWNMNIIKKLCAEFSEKCEDVFMLIYKYQNVEDLENYIYNEL